MKFKTRLLGSRKFSYLTLGLVCSLFLIFAAVNWLFSPAAQAQSQALSPTPAITSSPVPSPASSLASSSAASFTIPTWVSQFQLQTDGSLNVVQMVNLLTTNQSAPTTAVNNLVNNPRAFNLLIPLPPQSSVSNFSVQEDYSGALIPIPHGYRLETNALNLTLAPTKWQRQYALHLTYQLMFNPISQPQSDLLAFNLLPPNYREKIGLVSATLTLPQAWQLSPTTVSHNILSTNPAAYHHFTAGKFLYVGKDLTSEAGFTIQAFLPKGYLPETAPLLAPSRLNLKSLSVILWAYPLLVIMVLLVAWWRREHSSPSKTTPLPAPGLLAFLAEEKISGRALTATLFSLAQAGHLKIVSQAHSGIFSNRQSYSFLLLKPATAQLKPHEHLLLHGLFDQTKRLRFLDLEERLQTLWPQWQQLLYEESLAHRYFLCRPYQERLRYVWQSSLLLLPPLAAILVSLSWASFLPLLTPAWASLLISAALLGTTLWFLPTKTASGFAAYHQALNQTAALAKNQWLEFLPLLCALGILPNWRSLARTTSLAPPSWYQDSRLAGKDEQLHSYLCELQTILLSAVPQHRHHYYHHPALSRTVSDLG